LPGVTSELSRLSLGEIDSPPGGEQDRRNIGKRDSGDVANRILKSVLLAAATFAASEAAASAGDLQALSQGFHDADACAKPFAGTHDQKAFALCLQGVQAKFKGTAAAKPSYLVGVNFNAWSLADALADAIDKDVFPDIKSRAKASKERQFAMKLFDQFRPTQKQQTIADGDLAKLVGASAADLKPIFDYYDGLPKK
jgi:hypothetical protein